MQEKLKQIFKGASMFTTNPDSDWRRLFLGLILIILGLMTWSFFFYAQVKQDIEDSGAQKVRSTGGVSSAQEDELRDLILELETKKSANGGVIDGSYVPAVLKTSDPSR